MTDEENKQLIAQLVGALDKCRCIIKFHVNAHVCCSFAEGEKPFSALDAYKEAVVAMDKANQHYA